MPSKELHIVTGAFGFSGQYIARMLLDAGHEVRTLTNSPNRPNPFKGAVEAHPFNWDRPEALAESLRGARVLYNTYWVRFNHRTFTHEEAVGNTLRLFEAAQKAGVERVVHVSISNPSEDSPFEYFRGKAHLERALKDSGLSYAILRPTVIYGKEGILINNIAWMLRRFPVFGLFGDGSYRIQPIFVEDFAGLAVRLAGEAENQVVEAIGPETFTFRELVEVTGRLIGKSRPIMSIPPALGLFVSNLIGPLVGDVVLTREEIGGLMAGLLHTDAPPAGETALTDWIAENASWLGRRYMSELARRRQRAKAYEAL